jgi:pimeloyl-ACP methyl ester carboxylesterase
MAGWLNRLGDRSYFSGIDWNVDCPNTTATKLPWRFEQLTKESVAPLAVIGHSVGGLLARFLGPNFPVQVRHVIALGSPLDVSSRDRIHPMVQVAFQLLTPLRQRGNPAFRACGSRACTCRFAKFAPEGSPHVRLLRDMMRQFATDEHLRRAAGV